MTLVPGTRLGPYVYIGLDNRLMAAVVNGRAKVFSVGAVTQLFLTHPRFINGEIPYDVMPDGQRFLVNTLPDATTIPLTLLTNWLALVPRDGGTDR